MNIDHLKYLLKHSGVYSLGTVFAQAAGFLLLPLYTSLLTPRDYGVAALIELTVTVVGSIVGMGVGYSIARFYSKADSLNEKNLVISNSYVITWVLSVIFVPILLSLSAKLSFLLFDDYVYNNIFSISILSFFIGLNVEVGLTYFIIRQKPFVYVFLSLSNTIVLIAFNIYFVAFKKIGLIGIFYSSFIVKSIFAILLILWILSSTKLRFSLSLCIEMIKYSLPLGVSTVFRILSQESDKFFINYYFSPVQTGIYVISSKFATALHVLITTTFNRSYHSIRFEICKEGDGPRSYGIILEQYLVIIFSFGLLISIYSKEIILVMTSSEYQTAYYYIPLLIVSWIVFGVKYHVENGMLINMKTKYITYISASSAIVNVLLNIILIPKLEIWGAVLSALLSNIFLTVISFVFSQKFYHIYIDFKKIIYLFIVVFLSFILSIVIKFDLMIIAIMYKFLIFTFYSYILVRFQFLELSMVRNKLFQK